MAEMERTNRHLLPQPPQSSVRHANRRLFVIRLRGPSRRIIGKLFDGGPCYAALCFRIGEFNAL